MQGGRSEECGGDEFVLCSYYGGLILKLDQDLFSLWWTWCGEQQDSQDSQTVRRAAGVHNRSGSIYNLSLNIICQRACDD